ncbi:MAG TPA: hypothetical protein VLH85_04820 [Levilinea sp.]|nr:hypothetical protein [Levilinea sp.]
MIKRFAFTLIALLLVFSVVTPSLAQSNSVEESPATTPFCVEGKFHPGIARLAWTFNLTYQEVAKWFCMGFDLGDIREALRDALRNGTTVEQELDEPICDPLTEECDPEDGEETDEPEDVDDKHVSVYCQNEEMRHPTAARFAELYEVSYTQIMEWFCEGFGFGQIKHALNTARHTEGDPQTYLDARSAGQGWGEIWKETGKPARVHPVFGENWKENRNQEADPPGAARGKPAKPGR